MMLILANRVFDEKGYTDRDVSVFIDIVEKILCAKPGTMAFLKEAIGDRDRRDQGGKDDAAGKSLRTLDARPAEGTESPTGSADAPVPSTRGS